MDKPVAGMAGSHAWIGLCEPAMPAMVRPDYCSGGCWIKVA